MTLEGLARDTSDVAVFLRRLAASPRFRDIVIMSSSRSAIPGISFQIRLRADVEALLVIRTSDESHGALGEGNRDPFEPLANHPELPGPVIAEGFLLAQLHLQAILSGEVSKAMLSDPSGRGWVVKQGDVVGRAESAAKGCEMAWRVDRINAVDIVFVGNAPAGCTSPPKRVLKLPR